MTSETVEEAAHPAAIADAMLLAKNGYILDRALGWGTYSRVQ